MALENTSVKPTKLSEADKKAFMAQRLKRKPKADASPTAIPKRVDTSPPPLTYAQEGVWYLEQLSPDVATYNMSRIWRLCGPLNHAALTQSFQTLLNRHESLRTAFDLVDGQPRQIIAESVSFTITAVDLRNKPQPEETALNLAQQEAHRPFDLTRAPLLRAQLLQLGANDHLLVVTIHHIISDGWSMGLLLQELSACYQAFIAGQTPAHLPDLPIQYADFATWQRTQLEAGPLEKSLNYWRQTLADASPRLELPTDYARPARQSYQGARVIATLPSDLISALKALGQREKASLFMTLLAGFNLLLQRQSGQHDIVLGTPMINRSRVETEKLIGYFLNNLVLRNQLDDAMTFRMLLQQVQANILDAFSHQDVPFEKLVQLLQPTRDQSYTPLFQVFFNMFTAVENNSLSLSGLTVEPVTAAVEVGSKFDFTLYLREHDGGVRLDLVYRTSLFSQARMTDLLAQYQQLLRQVVAEPERPLADFSLVTPAAQALLPDPAAALSQSWRGAVHQQLYYHAHQRPHQPAVIDAHGQVSYQALEECSNQLAHHLISQGIKPGDVVAIYGHRSAGLVWAWLGILKAGAAFVNLDPAYPADRLLHYLDVAQPAGLIALEAASTLPTKVAAFADGLSCRIALPAPYGANPFASQSTTPPDVSIGPDDTAYIAFTSGSTGLPKGVRGRHGPLSHFLPWQAEIFDLTIADRFSMLSGLSHDPLQRDIFTALWVGGTICIPDPEQVGNLNYLAVWMKRVRITFAHMTPPMCQILTETAPPDEILPYLRYVFFVGDKLTRQEVEKLRKLAPHATAINSYGSTETQRAVSYHLLPPEKTVSEQMPKSICPLGKGMPDVQVLVLTKHKQLTGIGELGEIYIRSPHLAGGYINDPVMTVARFIRNPFTNLSGDRLYRTGDLGRYRPDGTVEFAGRVDRQIKIRGFRVEPGEIENALSRHSDIQKAVVMVRDVLPGGRGLVAYLVSTSAGDLSLEALRTYLASQFPDYMIPTVLIPVVDIPLTPNGKIDYGALPEPDVSHMLATRQHAPPQGFTEERLAKIWQSLLEVETVGRHDNFFELGGHSLLAIRLFSQIEQEFAQKIPVIQLFQSPTIASLSEAIRAENASCKSSPLVTIQSGGSKPPVFLVHGFGGGVVGYGELARLLGTEQSVYGLQARGVDGGEESDTEVEVMARRYIKAMRTVQPRGPYCVGGYCYGGVIAFEIARQLEAQGEQLGLVAIFEGYAPLRGGNRESMWRSPRLMLNFARNMPYWFSDYLTLSRQQMKWRLKRKLRTQWKKFIRKFGVSVRWRAEDVVDDTSHLSAKQRLLMETHIRAMSKYDPGVYNGSVTLFRVRSQSLSRVTDFSMGWNRLVTGDVQIKMIDGSHHNILEQPHVRSLASQLQSSVEETKS